VLGLVLKPHSLPLENRKSSARPNRGIENDRNKLTIRTLSNLIISAYLHFL
jgi:hypothetical protein